MRIKIFTDLENESSGAEKDGRVLKMWIVRGKRDFEGISYFSEGSSAFFLATRLSLATWLNAKTMNKNGLHYLLANGGFTLEKV